MLPEQWEAIAADRRHDWEKESKLQRILAQIPKRPSRWRRGMGRIMVWVGSGLMRWGERLAARKCQESVSTVS